MRPTSDQRVQGLCSPWRTPVENLQSRMQRRKAQNIEFMTWLRKGQFSWLPPACVPDLRLCLSLSYIYSSFGLFGTIKREFYFFYEELCCSPSIIHSLVHNKLRLLSGPLWLGMAVPVRVRSKGQRELFNHLLGRIINNNLKPYRCLQIVRITLKNG